MSNQPHIDKAARVLHASSCCRLDGTSSCEAPTNSEYLAAGIVVEAVAPGLVENGAEAENERIALILHAHGIGDDLVTRIALEESR